MFSRERNNVVASYDSLLLQKSSLERELANIQRRKDLEVDKINKKYESKIEQVLRQQKSCDNGGEPLTVTRHDRNMESVVVLQKQFLPLLIPTNTTRCR